jgi:branched-chain amino acid transport system substrate-binding protein
MSSTPGKAMSPILSQGGLATITPTSTNPDITDPKFATLYRPAGKAVYFRTVTTDAFQGPNLANYFVDVHKVKTMYGLDDSGAYGIGISTAFERQAAKKGVTVMGHDRLDPKAADYTTVLTKIKALNPDLLYYGGDAQAGVKLAKQSYDIIPNMLKAGGDGMYGASIPSGAGFPSANGWYATVASPHMIEDSKLEPWVKRFAAKFSQQPSDYSITAYDAALVVLDAVDRVAKTGKPVTRAAVRDAIQASKVDTLQGIVFVRRERRPVQSDRQHLPGDARREIPGGRSRASIQIHRRRPARRRLIANRPPLPLARERWTPFPSPRACSNDMQCLSRNLIQ